MIHLNDISLHFDGKKILSNIHLKVHPGETVMMLGKNGSGKSSLLKLIDGRYPLQQGSMTLDAIPHSHYSSTQLAKCVATLTQDPLDSLFPRLTVKENCHLAHERAHGHSKIKISLEEHLFPFNPTLATRLNTLCEKLSGGEQQALVLALTCLSKPKILLLDEHTSALDPKTAENLMRLTQENVKSYGITCIISTHNLDHALRYGDRLIALHQGTILKDYPRAEKEILSLQQIQAECYDF
jgi:putative ABC transport system ATP-binding protein